MTNYFELLNLHPTFTLDPKALEVAYFSEQRKFHPDRFVGKPESERMTALARSADINKAYDTLKNPLPRAQHLLFLQGIRVGGDNDSVKPSQELLMEAMEWHESPNAKLLARLTSECITRIGNFFDTNDFQAMAQETLRLGYLLKIPALVAGSGD